MSLWCNEWYFLGIELFDVLGIIYDFFWVIGSVFFIFVVMLVVGLCEVV